jgi:hypothetical protein
MDGEFLTLNTDGSQIRFVKNQYPDRLFRFTSVGVSAEDLVVIPPKYIEQLKNMSEYQLSLTEALAKVVTCIVLYSNNGSSSFFEHE